MFQHYHFPFHAVSPTDEELMSYLQIPDKEGFALVEGIVRQTFADLEDTPEITGGYRVVTCREVSIPQGTVTCPDNVFHTGKRICRYMEGATQLALFICTAGERFTTLSHSYQQRGDFLEAFVVESIGSATVENAMEKIQAMLEKEARKEGVKTTNRYSPGYCDWPLSDQPSLFKAIGTHSTGITLTGSCLMQPIKSVSGMIGIGANVKKRPYGCAVCGSSTCVYRNIIHSNNRKDK